MNLTLMPDPISRTRQSTRLVSKPVVIAAGVLALRRSDGSWCELSGVSEELTTALLSSSTLEQAAELLPAQCRPGWQLLAAALVAQGLACAASSRHSAPVIEVLGSGWLADRVRSSVGSFRCDLTLVCSDSLEPDRGLLRSLELAGRQYLVVRADAVGATLGPHVIPGRTGGLCCLDQIAVDDDPTSWQLLLALSRTHSDSAAWAADWIIGQLQAQLREIASGKSRLIRSTLSVDESGEQRWSHWDRHPICCDQPVECSQRDALANAGTPLSCDTPLSSMPLLVA